MIGVVQVGSQAMADRYAYLPLIGIFVMVAWALAEVAEGQRWPIAIPALASFIVLMALSVAARHQLGYWTNNVTLWSHAVEVTGPNFKAQELLGTALADEGQIAEAAVHFRIGLAIDDRDPSGYFNLAVADQVQGKIQQSIDGYNAVLRRNPDTPLKSRTLNNLAMAYYQAANFPQAEVTYKAAAQTDPANYKTWLGMGLLEQKMGNFNAAALAFSQAAQLQPSVLDYLLLERSLQAAGRHVEAVTAHDKAQHLSSDLRTQEQIAQSLLAQ
jgi:protein O-mannosyl-transferase